MKYTKCEYCDKSVSNNNIMKHIEKCKNDVKPILDKSIYKFEEINDRCICLYCSKEYSKKGIFTHIWRNHTDEGSKHNPNIGYITGIRTGTNAAIKAKNEGRDPVKHTEEYKRKMSNSKKGVPMHTDKFKQEQRERAISRNLGGVRQSKTIEYNGRKLGSTYELILVQDLEKFDIKWDTCKRIPYIDMYGKKRTYTPDIYLLDYDIYLDPKNDFLINNINPSLGFTDFEKIELVKQQNDLKIFILDKNQLSWDYIKNNIIPLL